jgi:hypothetical protein
MASSLAQTDWLLARASSHLEQQKLYSFYKCIHRNAQDEQKSERMGYKLIDRSPGGLDNRHITGDSPWALSIRVFHWLAMALQAFFQPQPPAIHGLAPAPAPAPAKHLKPLH